MKYIMRATTYEQRYNCTL